MNQPAWQTRRYFIAFLLPVSEEAAECHILEAHPPDIKTPADLVFYGVRLQEEMSKAKGNPYIIGVFLSRYEAEQALRAQAGELGILAPVSPQGSN